MQTKGIMCSEDFKRAFNVRLAEKCCANCRHGECEYEGYATCRHPERNDGKASKYYPYNAHQSDVCDLWETKGETE